MNNALQTCGYNMGVMRRSAYLMVALIAVGDFASIFGFAPLDRALGSVMVPAWGCSLWLVGTGILSSVAWSAGALLVVIFCFGFPVILFGSPGISDCHTIRCIC